MKSSCIEVHKDQSKTQTRTRYYFEKPLETLTFQYNAAGATKYRIVYYGAKAEDPTVIDVDAVRGYKANPQYD